jgi:hypothetical protein
MNSKLGTFISKYHGVGDGRLSIAGIAAGIAALQKDFLLQSSTMLC